MISRVLQLRAPLVWVLFPLAAGLTAARLWPLPAAGPWLFLSIAFVGGLAAVRFAERPTAWACCHSLAVATAACVMLHLRFPYLHEWSQRPPREVTVIVEMRQSFLAAPTARTLGGLAVITSSAENEPGLRGRQVSYSAIRRISVVPERSGRYLVQGVLEPLAPAADGMGFDAYLANAGVRHRLSRARIVGEIRAPDRLRRWCNRAEDFLEKILSRGLAGYPAQRSLYLAMLLGEKAVMSPDQQNAFMQSGTFHVFSISGLHVGVIALALQTVLRWARLPKRAAVGLTLILLWVYVQVTGNSSPAVRAFLMIAFMLASGVFPLPANPLAALTGAAVLTLLLDPLQLFSTGFQMSYAVVAALTLMGRPLADHWLNRWQPFRFRPKPEWRWHHREIDKRGRTLIGTVAASWPAFLASAPAGIGFFGLLSTGSLLANLIVVPLSCGVIYLGFASLVSGLLSLAPLTGILNRIAAVLITLIERILEWGVKLPGMFFAARFRVDWLSSVSLALMIGTMLFGAATGWSRRWGGYWPPFVLLGLLLIFCVKFG